MCVNREQLGILWVPQTAMGKLSHKKQQSQALSLPLPSSVPMFLAHHSGGQRASRTCVGSYLLHATLPCGQTPQSALPERNTTIQAFALVQTSAELKANLLKTLASPFKGPLQSKALSLLTVQSWLPPAGWRQAFRAHPLWLFSARLLSGLFLHFARGLSFPSFPMLLTFTGKHQSDSSEIMLRMIWGCATLLDSLL